VSAGDRTGTTAPEGTAVAGTVVLAVGGGAVSEPGAPVDGDHLRRAVRRAAPALAAAIGDRPAVVTHGNGPQVGRLAADAELVASGEPLDQLDALTQGELGYLLVEALTEALPRRDVVGVITRVEVDPTDAAMDRPTKPIGLVLDDGGAAAARARGWQLRPAPGPDGMSGWQRVVASPRPRRIPELGAVAALLRAGHVVVAVGGGGIPVAVDGAGRRHGVEAVVDKDLASALLAVGLDAELLVVLTDVDAVVLDRGTPHAVTLGRVRPAELDPGRFEPGTMRPKVEAVQWFATATGRRAAIGALADAEAVAAGRAGTQVVPGR
jgi:carbamate kinase